MKTIQLMKVLVLIMVAATCSMSAFAQQTNEQKQIPEGTWVLESVAAVEENAPILFNVDSIGFEVPAEMGITQNEITFVYKEATQKVKYNAVVKGSSLCIPVCARWSVTDNKLQLQWSQDVDSPSGGAKTRIITLSYSQK